MSNPQRTAELSRLALLYQMSLSSEIADDEQAEFDRLEAKYPDWPAEIAPPPELPVLGPPPTDDFIELKNEVFTQDELQKIARWQHCEVKKLKYRWIIQRGPYFYVLGPTGEYMTPISKSELAVSLPRDLARVPSVAGGAEVPDGYICWQKKIGDKIIDKSVDDMLKDYASVARPLVTTLLVERSYYEPATQTFYERVCPQRKLAPTYHPLIDEWLTLLGGDRADLLKDWVAAAVQLDKPICALYVWGVQDVGKSLLATGLARLWGGAATKLASVASSFNSAMADSPLVLADEEIPNSITSSFLRDFIGNRAHSLRRKGIAESIIYGYYRLIVAANDSNLLKFENEDINRAGMDAIIARVLFVHADEKAAAFVNQHRDEVRRWAEGDHIAEHALWLRHTRLLHVKRRYLVEGVNHDARRYIGGTAAAIKWLVLEVICRAMMSTKNPAYGPSTLGLTKDSPRLGLDDGIQWGDGHIYVNASWVRDNWQAYLGDNRPPSSNQIGRTLKPMAVPTDNGNIERRLPIRYPGAKDLGRADFYHLDPEIVYEAAREIQIGTPDDFHAMVHTTRLRSVDTPAPALPGPLPALLPKRP